jgi:Mg2+/citrate symporter
MLSAGGSSRHSPTKVESNMSYLVHAALVVCAIVELVCFVMVIMKMFQNDQTGMAIICIIGVFCCFGGILTFVLGWMNSTKWGIKNVMMAWTGAFIFTLIFGGVGAATGLFQQLMPKM